MPELFLKNRPLVANSIIGSVDLSLMLNIVMTFENFKIRCTAQRFSLNEGLFHHNLKYKSGLISSLGLMSPVLNF